MILLYSFKKCFFLNCCTNTLVLRHTIIIVCLYIVYLFKYSINLLTSSEFSFDC